MKNIVIIYHGECSDGFSGAWAAWKKFGNKADYFGIKHRTVPVAELKNKEIYFIDIVYPEKEMKKIIKESKKTVIIDHHITATKIAKMADENIFALNHSGATLAWKYFHPKKSIPRLLRHVEDIDLWKFKLPNTRAIFAYCNLFKFDFKIWNKIISDFEKTKNRRKIIKLGGVILRHEKRVIERLVGNAELVKFAGYTILAVNSPILMSEIGAALVAKKPPIGIIWYQRKNQRVFSLRSNGKADVAKIAQRFGGGGHKAASGFSLKMKDKLPWKAI